MSYMNWPVLFWFKCPGIIGVELGVGRGGGRENLANQSTC